MEAYAWALALTRMISAVFRRGGDVSFVVDELKAIFDPRGGQWMGGRYVPSLLAAIGEVIERHMIEIGFLGMRAPAPRRSRWRSGAARRRAGAFLPALRRGQLCASGRLRFLPVLRLFQMRLKRQRCDDDDYSSRFWLLRAAGAVLSRLAAWAMAPLVDRGQERSTKSSTAMNGHQAMPGITVSWASQTISGFPFRVDVVFTDLLVRAEGAAWALDLAQRPLRPACASPMAAPRIFSKRRGRRPWPGPMPTAAASA